MSLLRAAFIVFVKDLRIELRTGETVKTTALFAFLTTILTSLSFYLGQNRSIQVAPGIIWIAITFAGILVMNRSWNIEREAGAINGLLISPIPRAAIYLGKVLGSIMFLMVIEIFLVSIVSILFQVDLFSVLCPLWGLLLLGTFGFAATGNLFAAIGMRTRARDMVLGIAVFPIIAPALLCGVIATRELLNGAPLAEIFSWVRVLTAFDIIFITIGLLLFETLLSD